MSYARLQQYSQTVNREDRDVSREEQEAEQRRTEENRYSNGNTVLGILREVLGGLMLRGGLSWREKQHFQVVEKI